jgi:phosphopantothenoylcysteine decarboxylase / phosphopantothenate---cysteine ligase
MTSLPLSNRRIVLGLTGGIACYKSATLVRLLTKAGASVQVVMTEAACQFITPLTMQALSGQTVFMSQWDAREANNMAHINLSRHADAVLIAPASTDFLAKLAHGLCDDLLSTLCIARPNTIPLLVAPAMNREMWDAPATQRNIHTLRHDGVHILGPGHGSQACGEFGDGRMLEPEELLEGLIAFFTPKCLSGKKILITAGPTFEPIDPVRGVTNRSSGKMGFAVARAAAHAGAEVTLIAGPVTLPTPIGCSRINVSTAQEMFEAVMPRARCADIFIGVAAVADWRIAEPATSKLKKDGSGQAPHISWIENPDILASVARLPEDQRPYCVGFAAESEDLATHGPAKRQRKQIPLLVGNIGPATFGADDNALVLFDDHGSYELPRADKHRLAVQLVDEMSKRIHLIHQ